MEYGNQDIILYYYKEDKFNDILVHCLKDFLGVFNRHGGRGGRRSVEYQNDYNVVTTVVNGGDMKLEKLLRYLYKKLAVFHRQINRGHLLRRYIYDIDKKGWIRVNRKLPTDSIKEGKTMWFWKYDILLCILFTFQYHMHVLIYLLHYISSLYLSTEHWAIIAEALHTEKFSIIDNANKILVIVNNGIFYRDWCSHVRSA